MIDVFFWMLALTVGVVAIIISAGSGSAEVHMAICALMSLGLALLAIRENRSLHAANASRNSISASTARHMGLVWIWGSLGLLVIYLFILDWHEWWQFFVCFSVAGVLCLFLATAIERDGATGNEDETVLNLARYLAWGQLAGMVAAVIGLIVDTDKRFLDTGREDWAANSIFFFGAVAIAAITTNALITDRRPAA